MKLSRAGQLNLENFLKIFLHFQITVLHILSTFVLSQSWILGESFYSISLVKTPNLCSLSRSIFDPQRFISMLRMSSELRTVSTCSELLHTVQKSKLYQYTQNLHIKEGTLPGYTISLTSSSVCTFTNCCHV